MFKTFNFGVIIGLIGAAVLLWYVPIVDQYREGSLITVQPNGGNMETFRINLPKDRILAGAANASNPVPPGLEWPDDRMFANSQTELFKVRDRRDAVIGIASRIASTDPLDPFIHWMLHLPARGSMFMTMSVNPTEAGHRDGLLQSGTREFATLTGSIEERYVSEIEQEEFDVEAHIELRTALVAPIVEEEPEVATE